MKVKVNIIKVGEGTCKTGRDFYWVRFENREEFNGWKQYITFCEPEVKEGVAEMVLKFGKNNIYVSEIRKV